VVHRDGRRRGNADGLSRRQVRDELQIEYDEKNEVTISDQNEAAPDTKQLPRIQAIEQTATERVEKNAVNLSHEETKTVNKELLK